MSSSKATPTPAKQNTPNPQDKTASPFIKFMSSHYTLIGLLALVTIILFSKFVFTDAMLYGSDTMGNLDSRVWFHSVLTECRQFPMWFVTRLGGMPTLDVSFGDSMYPPSFLSYLLLPTSKALGIRLVVHVFAAGLFFYLMMHKGFKSTRLVAFAGAVLYMLNAQFVSHVYPGHDGKMIVIAWVPFMVWQLKVLMETPTLLTSTLLSLGLAAMLYGGHTQLTYFTLWGLFLYWCLALVQIWITEKSFKPLIPRIGFFWLGIALGILAAFVQFYPSYAFVRDAFSVRGVDRGFEFASSWSLHWPEVFSLWVPEFCGSSVGNANTYWSENPFKLNTEYAGMIPLMLGSLALVVRFNAWRIFWGAIALTAVGFALGAHSPIYYVAYYLVPGVKKFRACSMIMFWFSFAASLLTGLLLMDIVRGRLSDLAEQLKAKWSKGLLIAIAAVTGLAVLFSLKSFVAGLMEILVPTFSEAAKNRAFEANFSASFVPYLWLWWIMAIGTLGLLWGVVNGKVKREVFVIAVLAIGLVDLFRVDSAFIQTTDPRQYFSTPPALKALADQMKKEPFRCYSLPGTLPQNGEGVHGLEGVGGFHDNELRWYREFRGDQQDRNYLSSMISVQNGQAYLVPQKIGEGNNFLDLANARYVLARQQYDFVVIENKNALGRLSFVPGYVVIDSSQMLSAIAGNSYDIRSVVALTAEPDFKPQQPAPHDSTQPRVAASVAWDKYTPNFRKAEVEAPQDGFLRISEVYYPAWKVKVDGKETKIYRADLAWMAIGISKGKHTVEIIPHSPYFKTAITITVPVLAALLLYWCFCFIRFVGRRRTQTVQP